VVAERWGKVGGVLVVDGRCFSRAEPGRLVDLSATCSMRRSTPPSYPPGQATEGSGGHVRPSTAKSGALGVPAISTQAWSQ